jgi:hypothetical protein
MNGGTASGDYSVCLGLNSTSSGVCSFAAGTSTTAGGDYSVVAGRYLSTTSYGCAVFGVNGTALGGTASSFVSTEPIFQIGNGASTFARKSAVVVLKNGYMGINNITAPKSPLHVGSLPVYANNAAAIAGGLTAGAFYRTGADPDPVCVVH